jgi:beta-glucosidase
VHFDFSPRDLSSVTEAGDRVVAAGRYTISVGEGQPGTDAPAAAGHFAVEGNTSLPE